MQNFSLLKRLGKASKPILLKRGLSATIREFLNVGGVYRFARKPTGYFM